MTAPRRVSIRQAGPEDVADGAELLRRRDGIAYAQADAEAYLGGFDPERTMAWIAHDGARPVGLSMVYLRSLEWRGVTHRVGYWGNLFVDPDYRKAMIYPRLPIAMFRGARAAGVEHVLTATRRHESSGVHLQLGCRELGRVPVLMKPLKPFALLSRRRGWNAGELARLPDFAFGALARFYTLPERLRGGVEEIPWRSRDAERLLDLRREAGAGLVGRSWTLSAFRDRFAATLEGDPYVLLGVRAGGDLSAGLVYRTAVRSGVRAGVILDLFFRPGGESAIRRALAAAERRALDEGAEVMLFLDGLPLPVRSQLTRLGYFRSPETYHLLVWPADIAATPHLTDLRSWWFTFADHDAF